MLGTVDENGTVVSTRKYDVYGAVRGSTGPGGTKHKFVGGLGHPSEDETGLVYMRARYYDPVTGRFIREDPSHDGINWFIYANNSPVFKTDPTGRFCFADCWTAFATVETLMGGVCGFLAGFFGSIAGDHLNGNDVNWGNAFCQGGIWGASGMLAVGLAGAIKAVHAARGTKAASGAGKAVEQLKYRDEYLKMLAEEIDAGMWGPMP